MLTGTKLTLFKRKKKMDSHDRGNRVDECPPSPQPMSVVNSFQLQQTILKKISELLDCVLDLGSFALSNIAPLKGNNSLFFFPLPLPTIKYLIQNNPALKYSVMPVLKISGCRLISFFKRQKEEDDNSMIKR